MYIITEEQKQQLEDVLGAVIDTLQDEAQEAGDDYKFEQINMTLTQVTPVVTMLNDLNEDDFMIAYLPADTDDDVVAEFKKKDSFSGMENLIAYYSIENFIIAFNEDEAISDLGHIKFVKIDL